MIGTRTSPAGRRRAAAMLAAVAAVLTLLTGCAVSTTADEGVASAPPASLPDGTPTPSFTPYPMPELGPSPAPEALTAERTEALRLAEADATWQGVLRQHPDAVRPEVAFEGYLAEPERLAAVEACLTAKGIAVGYGRSGPGPDDEVVAVSARDSDVASEVGGWACRSSHPTRPVAPQTAEQLGWLYDYLTGFLVPCYAQNGFESAPPPGRDEFVAAWPNQGWWPVADFGTLDDPGYEALAAACPPPV